MMSLLKNSKNKLSKRGIILAIAVIFLCGFALLILYDASYYSANKNFGDPYYFVKKQSIAMCLGIVFMLVLSFVKIDFVKKITIPFLIASFILLIIIFIPGVGVESYGARRWINLKITTIQPSELSKFGLIMFCAKFMENRDMKKVANCLPILVVGGIMCVLLILEPNMSVTVLIASLMILMLFLGGASYKLFFVLIIPLIACAVALILTEPYRLQRLMAFIDPWANPKGEGYQLIQSYYALGSGGWFGVGLFGSRQKYMFLPFAESDFIFSIVGEELGFIGALFVIGIYILIVFLGFDISKRCTSRFDALLSGGISAVICMQTLLNLAVVSGSIPPTGIPLPFMSYGGSSLVCFCSAVGVLLSIDRKTAINFLSIKDFGLTKKKGKRLWKTNLLSKAERESKAKH